VAQLYVEALGGAIVGIQADSQANLFVFAAAGLIFQGSKQPSGDATSAPELADDDVLYLRNSQIAKRSIRRRPEQRSIDQTARRFALIDSQQHGTQATLMSDKPLVPFCETTVPGCASAGGDDPRQVVGRQCAQFIHSSPSTAEAYTEMKCRTKEAIMNYDH